MPAQGAIDAFDAAVAAKLTEVSEKVTGLPAYLGIRIVEFTPGRLRCAMDARAELMTPFGNMHGGVLSALCDHVLGTVCYPHMQRGQWAATTEFKINLLAPVKGGEVTADAEIVSFTRATAVVRIEISNDDRSVGLAQGTVLIRTPKR